MPSYFQNMLKLDALWVTHTDWSIDFDEFWWKSGEMEACMDKCTFLCLDQTLRRQNSVYSCFDAWTRPQNLQSDVVTDLGQEGIICSQVPIRTCCSSLMHTNRSRISCFSMVKCIQNHLGVGIISYNKYRTRCILHERRYLMAGHVDRYLERPILRYPYVWSTLGYHLSYARRIWFYLFISFGGRFLQQIIPWFPLSEP